ncbi:MAG TPA: ATP-dependent DNA ligase, partial [Acidimicrobiia bacterium]|nr:ATP-dependent DNA ligase [Acidimicrobiia bacterium]
DQGDPWEDMDEHGGSLDGAMALWEADLERGLGEMPFPPDYPKMPGEPRRVQPSKRRDDLPDPVDRPGYKPRPRWIDLHPEEAEG